MDKDYINYIVNYLQAIQEDLIGILIPTIITAVLSLLTLIVNSIIQYKINDRQYKSKQYEIMREYYPSLKSNLVKIRCIYQNIENNPLYKSKSKSDFVIIKYLKFDWEKFRQELDVNQVQYVDSFEESVQALIKIFIQLNIFFNENNMPTSSKKVRYEINHLQFFCVYFDDENAIKNWESPPAKYSKKDIEKLIKVLDKHYNKF